MLGWMPYNLQHVDGFGLRLVSLENKSRASILHEPSVDVTIAAAAARMKNVFLPSDFQRKATSPRSSSLQSSPPSTSFKYHQNTISCLTRPPARFCMNQKLVIHIVICRMPRLESVFLDARKQQCSWDIRRILKNRDFSRDIHQK